MAATIGIKIANGDFYSVMEENTAVKKRLVLTTVHNNQKSVQIDLYKSYTKSMADALYIGSLVVENLSLKARGEPSIELVISGTADGIITAESFDLGNPSGEHQHLSLHLKSFEEDAGDYSDFDIEESGGGLYEKSTSIRDADAGERKFPWVVLVVIAIVVVLLGLGLWYFLFGGRGLPGQSGVSRQSGEPIAESPEPASAVEESVESAESPTKQPEPAQPELPKQPVSEAPASQAQPAVIDTPPRAQGAAPTRQRRNVPVYSFNVPQTIPPGGIVYRIRWGDTLWDLSEAFYRNPWLYPAIVRHNRIRNPNLIVSGTEITIPAR
ncbi:MAG: Hsp70 family protein [Treponema sp.]|nr:Hsp70 family protein [Treponema sp.]